MAKTKRDQELFDMLRARGLRKRVAKLIAEVPKAGNGQLPAPARQAIAELKALGTDIEKRLGLGTTRSRSQSAQKSAATRQRNAARRSQAARKAARTRASAKK